MLVAAIAASLIGTLLAVVGGLSAPAYAATAVPTAEPTTLTLTGPTAAASGAGIDLDVALLANSVADDPSQHLPGPVSGPVTVWTYVDGVATQITTVVTDADGAGAATVTMSSRADDNRFYAVFDGDATYAGSQSAEITVASQNPPPTPGPITTGLTLDTPTRALKRRDLTLRARLLGDGDPLTGRQVVFEREVGNGWTDVGRVATDPSGRASVVTTMPTSATRVSYRARFAGTSATGTSPAVTGSVSPVRSVAGLEHPSVITLAGPRRLVDEQTAALRIRARTADGEAIIKARVLVEQRDGTRWTQVASRRTDLRGLVTLDVAPRVDTRYRARLVAGSYFEADASPVLAMDNIPPGTPVVLPAGAPAPRITLPPQRRAVGEAANVSVTLLPDGVWADMQGRSWRPGCTPRSSLRLLRTNYWGFDGYRHRGELVIAAAASEKFVRAVRAIYAARLPIRHMYRVDRFGYSDRVRGADDYASMAADNTSAFNCRDVVGRPGVRSPHSAGRSFDVNPWENPYLSSAGWVPTRWWVGRSHPRVAWRSATHPMVRVLREAGFGWTYGIRDAHHFDA